MFYCLFNEAGRRVEKQDYFFKWYPTWQEHLFEEAFWFEGEVLHRRKYLRSYAELMFLSVLALLEQNISIRRCACCGGYFIPKTKKMTLYCDRAIKGGKTCKDLAPGLKRRQDKKQDAFFIWSTKAQTQRKKYVA